MPKSIFEHAGMVNILVFLYKQKGAPVNFTTIHKNVQISIETLRRTLNVAINLDLIKEEKKATFPYESEITLTTRGQLIGAHLSEVLASLESKND